LRYYNPVIAFNTVIKEKRIWVYSMISRWNTGKPANSGALPQLLQLRYPLIEVCALVA
jgi:hypothetical protein